MKASVILLALVWLSSKISISFSKPFSVSDNSAPPHLLTRLIKVVGEDVAPIWTFAWSPDSRKIVSGGHSGNVSIWSVEGPTPSDWTFIKTISRSDTAVSAVAWSPDGTRIASVGYDKKIMVWSVEGTDPATWGVKNKSIGEHLVSIGSMAWSPDSTKLVTGGYGDRKLIIWRMEGWDDSEWGLWTEQYAYDNPTCLAWSPDGTKVAFGRVYLRIWIVQSPDHPPIKHVAYVGLSSIAWSPDGTKIATGGPWMNITIWDVSGSNPSQWGRQWKTIGQHSDNQISVPDLSVAWSSDSTKLASIGNHGRIIVWSVNGADIWQSGLSKKVVSETGGEGVAWSPDMTKLAAAGSSLQVWGVESPDFSQSALIKTVGEHDDDIRAVAWSPDGSRVVTGAEDNKIRIWSVGGSKPSQWQLIETLGEHKDEVVAVAWSPDGKKVATAGLDNQLKVWNLEGANPGQWGMMFAGDYADQCMLTAPVAWSPDSKKIVTVGSGLTIWNVSGSEPSEWRLIKTLDLSHATGECVTAVSWSPDGTKIATGGWDGENNVAIWSVEGSAASQWFMMHRRLGKHRDMIKGIIRAVAWSPDGTKIASGSNTDHRVCVWRVPGFNSSQEALIKNFSEHTSAVSAVSWSLDGTKLVTGGYDFKVIVWDVKSSDPSDWAFIKVIGELDSFVTGLACSPDGAKVASVGFDKKLKIWSTLGDSSQWKWIETNGKEPGNLMNVSYLPDAVAPVRAYMNYHGYYPEQYSSKFNVTVFQSSAVDEAVNCAVDEAAGLLPRNWGSPYWPMFDELNFKGARSIREIVMPHYTSTVSFVGLKDMVTNLQLLWARTAPVHIGRLDASHTSLYGPLDFLPPEGLKFISLRYTSLESVELEAWLNLSEGLDIRHSKLDNLSLSCPNCIWRSGMPRCAEMQTGADFNSVFCRACNSGWYMRDAHSSCQKCIPWEWGLDFAGIILACGLASYFVFKPLRIRIHCRVPFQALSPQHYSQSLGPHWLYLQNKISIVIIAYQILSTLRHLTNPLPKIASRISDRALFFQFKWMSSSHVATCWFGSSFLGIYSLRTAELLVWVIVACILQTITGKKTKTWFVGQIVKFTSVSVASDSVAMFQCDDRLKHLAYIPIAPEYRKSFLRVDYTVICHTKVHVHMQVAATIVMSVWCFLLPGIAVAFLCMPSGKHRLTKGFLFLYEGKYTDQSWWFFLLAFLMKPVISFAYAFGGEHRMSQRIFGAYTAFAYALNTWLIGPYKLKSDTYMEVCAFLCVSLSFALAGQETEFSAVMLAVVMCIPASALLICGIGSIWQVPASEFRQLHARDRSDTLPTAEGDGKQLRLLSS